MPIARPSSTIRVYIRFIGTRNFYQNPLTDKENLRPPEAPVLLVFPPGFKVPFSNSFERTSASGLTLSLIALPFVWPDQLRPGPWPNRRSETSAHRSVPGPGVRPGRAASNRLPQSGIHRLSLPAPADAAGLPGSWRQPPGCNRNHAPHDRCGLAIDAVAP